MPSNIKLIQEFIDWSKQKHPMKNLIFQIYQTEHFSTQVACIFKLGYQILVTEIDNPAATLLSTLALSEASSLALPFLEHTELLQSMSNISWTSLGIAKLLKQVHCITFV